MKKILVLGGTLFFGKKAVERLIANGHEVTIATRGSQPHPFGDKVEHIILDARDSKHEGWHKVSAQNWDAVFNNVLYTKEDAELMIDRFSGLTNHFYFTSSMSVYSGAKDGYVEEDFDPVTYDINPEIEVDYGEGKRQAESVLFKEAPFNVTVFRFPIVLDFDDYTQRLHFYVEKSLNKETIYFKDKHFKVNYVKGTTAADSIVWAIENQKEGIYNISSLDAVTVETLLTWLEEAIDHPVHVEFKMDHSQKSPFSTSHDQYLISNKIHEEGFELSPLESWMPSLMKKITVEMESK